MKSKHFFKFFFAGPGSRRRTPIPLVLRRGARAGITGSAILPFRKLWLSSETCAFEKVRDFVFQIHPDQNQLRGYCHWFYDIYSRQLTLISKRRDGRSSL